MLQQVRLRRECQGAQGLFFVLSELFLYAHQK